MAGSRNPAVVTVSMAVLGALLTAAARFGYLAYIIVQAGESLGSVPVKALLVDVMSLHWYLLYGAAGGALFGVFLVVMDWVRDGSRKELGWSARGEANPMAGDEVKARRMEMGERYLTERDEKGRGE